MKKTFKNLLRTALTAAAVAVLSVGMAVSVSAATKVYEYIPNASVTNTNNFFTVSSNAQFISDVISNYEVTKADGTKETMTKALKTNSKGTVTFTVEEGKTAKATVLWSIRTSKNSGTTEIYLNGTKPKGSATAGVGDTAPKSYSTGVLEAGNYTFKGNGTEGGIYYVRVDVEVPEGAVDYKLTGTVADVPAGTKVTFTNAKTSFEATVDAEGALSYATTSAVAPFAVGDKFTVTAPQYDATPSEVTIGGTDPNFTIVETISFKPMALVALANAKYTDSQIVLPSFDYLTTGANVTGTFKFTGDVKFMLDKPSKVTVEAKNGSSNTGTAQLVIKSESGTLLADTGTMNPGDGYDVANNTVTVSVPAGTYTITATATDTNVQIRSITVEDLATSGADYYVTTAVDTYVIHAVTADEMKYAELGINGANVGTTEVYKAVVIDDKTINASDLGATAIYAIQVKGTNGKIRTADLTWVDTAA